MAPRVILGPARDGVLGSGMGGGGGGGQGEWVAEGGGGREGSIKKGMLALMIVLVDFCPARRRVSWVPSKTALVVFITCLGHLASSPLDTTVCCAVEELQSNTASSWAHY